MNERRTPTEKLYKKVSVHVFGRTFLSVGFLIGIEKHFSVSRAALAEAKPRAVQISPRSTGRDSENMKDFGHQAAVRKWANNAGSDNTGVMHQGLMSLRQGQSRR
jgi:hypothetical protein